MTIFIDNLCLLCSVKRNINSVEMKLPIQNASYVIRQGLRTNHENKWGGRGFAQMSTLFNKRHLVKLSTKGEGVKNTPNSVYVVCTQPHTGMIWFGSLVANIRTKKVDEIFEKNFLNFFTRFFIHVCHFLARFLHFCNSKIWSHKYHIQSFFQLWKNLGQIQSSQKRAFYIYRET